MLRFSSLWDALTDKDYYRICFKWSDSKGDHVRRGYWYQDHIISVIAWADAHDLEVVSYVQDVIYTYGEETYITINLDSCGEDFEE